MSRILKSTMLVVACFAFSSISSRSADPPSGQILGGSLNSPVRIEVFSDFQCPHCRDFFLGTIRPLLQEYSSKDKVCVIYHEFPLAGHPYAREAARYTEAAAQLGQQKLLPLYDSIFTNQAQWSEDGKLEATVAKALPQDDFLKVKKVDAGSQHQCNNRKRDPIGDSEQSEFDPHNAYLLYRPRAEG